jgi:non-specific serine/threonine protein kinase
MAASGALLPTSPPIPRSRLVGRQTEQDFARRLLLEAAAPLLTLTGTGGVGKTHLALVIARDIAASFADGVVWVDLAPLREPGLVPTAVADALALPRARRQPVEAALVEYLRDRRLLLLLDNCEHVVTAVSALVAQLLASCASLQILATSRMRLGVRGEQVLPLNPLPLPAPEVAALEALAHNEAIRLFVDRAQAVCPSFTLTVVTAPAVAALCRQLDGLPLAIELAAAHSAVFTPEQMLARLAIQPGLPGAGPRDLPARQQTMHTVIAWSYDLLAPRPQALFRRLAVFAGSFTLEAAEVVCDDGSSSDVAADLESVVEQSLLRRPAEGEDPPRFAFLETVREFAVRLLDQSGEAGDVRSRHAAHVLAMVETAAQANYTPAERDWMLRLTADLPNLRAALAWAATHDDSMLRRLVRGLWWYWRSRGSWAEADGWLRRAIGTPPTADVRQAELLVQAADVAMGLGDETRAESLLAGAIARGRETGDVTRVAEALMAHGQLLAGRGDVQRGERLLTESLDIWRTLPEPAWTVGCGMSLGWALYAGGQHDRAWSHFQDAVTLGRAIGFRWGLATALLGLGHTHLVSGRPAEARAALDDALAVAVETADPVLLSEGIELAAAIALTRGEGEAAARLVGASEALLAPTRYVRPALQQQIVTRLTMQIQTRLGMETAWTITTEGRACSWDDAMALAQRIARTATRGSAARSRSVLSPRELDVLRLAAEGKSDREIAVDLGLSYRTVTSYMAGILNKLGVNSRTAAAASAVRRGWL